MANDQFAGLGEIRLSQYGATSRWGPATMDGRSTLPSSTRGESYLPGNYRSYRPAEAEDAVGQYSNRNTPCQNKPGMYYSPPGTSYTILEKNSGLSNKPKVSYLGTPNFSSANTRGVSNKKRPISPEQVIKMFSSSSHRSKNKPKTSSVASDIYAQYCQLSRDRTNNNNCNSVNNNCSINSNNNNNCNVNNFDDNHKHNNCDNINVNSNNKHHFEHPVRTVSMSRDAYASNNGNHGFGICVKGGSREPDTVGVYISRVEEGSIAERAGLRPGDSILEVNGIPFSNITHEEALRILKSTKHINMRIRTTPLSHNSKCLSSWLIRQTYTWTDRQGRSVSPPPDYSDIASSIPSIAKIPRPNISKEKIRKVELTVDSRQTLGLTIRGGMEYGLGIFITGVDKDSVADKAGIQIGDQILDSNGKSFLEISHDEAICELKKHFKLTLTIRDVGKIPHSVSSVNSDAICDDQPSRQHPKIFLRSETLQMIEEKAMSILNETEFHSFSYYLEEYISKRMSIDAFITVLYDMLNTPEKYTLMTEVREIIFAQDKLLFDEAIYRERSVNNRRPKNTEGVNCGEVLQNHQKNIIIKDDLNGPFRSPSEDSGLGLGPPDVTNGRNNMSCKIIKDTELPVQSSQSMASNEEDLGYYHQEYGEIDHDGHRQKRNTEDNNNLARINNCEDTNALAQKLGRSCAMKDEQRRLPLTAKKESTNEKTPNVTTDAFGNLRVIVKKTKPLLGIAMEGGANTKHPLPRIINIHENGAAYEAGGLEVGQLILEVNGHSVEGLQHQEVARLIAESYAAKDKPNIEFLVVEAKKSNLEPKPTALIFMNS